jgi:hypothetical protein
VVQFVKPRRYDMQVINDALLTQPRGTLKFILNESGIIFFSGTQQHRDIKLHGLSYEDDYGGNAVAGLVLPERVEIRFHNAFTDDRIRTIWRTVLKIPALGNAKFGQLYYQGREIL